MPKLYVEYALSFGVTRYEELWKIQYLHPEDAYKKVEAWLPMKATDERIGKEYNDIPVAKPGPRMMEVMGWLYDRITRYPYYWPKEGGYVDKFGYDFEVDIALDGKTSDIEITQVAYDILKEELRIPPPTPASDREVDVEVETIPEGGVLVKMSVTLDRAQPISEFVLAPFTKYPLELVSLMYEEDTETFHPKKELILPEANKQSETVKFQQTTESIRLQFPVVIAKRITFVLRQQNHEKNTYNVKKENVDKNRLWQSISQREAEITLDTEDGLETVTQQELDKLSGYDIYLEELKNFQKELLKWLKDFELYKQKQAERDMKLKEKAAEDKRYAEADSAYRSDYKKAVEKYKTVVRKYEQDMDKYITAQQKYKEDMKVYEKYLRDFADWKSKWG